MHEQPLQSQLTNMVSLFQRGAIDEVRRLCEPLARSESPQELLVASQVFQQMGDFDSMVAAVQKAVALAPAERVAQTRLVECHIYNGRVDLARALLDDMARAAQQDSAQLQRVASLYLHCSSYDRAHRCYEQAQQLLPRDAGALYNLASSCVSMGDMDRAEALYNDVIALQPDDFDAYQNRSTLRVWTAQNHHLDELTHLMRRLPEGNAGRVPIGYALAKEYEDLGDFDNAFAALEFGARSRRASLAYRVENDVAAMACIAEAFNPEVLGGRRAATSRDPSLFVLGLPRSGTTLVDRILSSHSQVKSLGEINAFAFALMQLASGPGDKLQMVKRSTQLDFAKLGQNYRRAIQAYDIDTLLLLNKTPSNFLYLGLIHLALPGAKTVHLRRHPLDSCFAMFKTLFRMGYPFSYSLEDLGQYYLAYHRLMAHWRQTIPGSFHEVDYEYLVDHQEPATRQLLQYCGLPWEATCLAFHRNSAPAATASAAQVRKPLYRSSLQLWRRYERQLAPLTNMLQNHGVDCA